MILDSLPTGNINMNPLWDIYTNGIKTKLQDHHFGMKNNLMPNHYNKGKFYNNSLPDFTYLMAELWITESLQLNAIKLYRKINNLRIKYLWLMCYKGHIKALNFIQSTE
jgi:hypothetical protein